MKHSKIYLIFICLLLSSLNIAFAAYNPSDGIFYLKTGDGHEEYTVEGTVTFKCVASGTIPTYRDAGVTFAPANAGELIHIKVEQIDLDGTTNYLLLYNGYIQTGYSGASDGVGQGSYMPAGWFAKIGAAQSGNEYQSESPDGKLTIGFHSSSANGQTGFNITVTSLSPKDMEFVSAGVFLDNASVNRGGRSQILLGVNIQMDGGGNPQTLNELVFNTSAFSSVQIENLRLYASDNFTDANLLASLPTLGATISYNNDITLRSGDNKFYIVADIKPDASGTIPSATLSSVKINNESKPISPAEANSLAVANTILMGTEHLTYTISDDANFYDDGGINGKISANFQGIITFVPATAGEQIKIDFSKLEIFNTSSTGYNDVFKFYNGQTVDESKLITTLLKDAEIVKSTADDGSLTVTLKSTTGVPANGWEAVVSEFVPGAMTLDAITAKQALTSTLAASSTNEYFILLNIKTTNTLTPLEVQGITIDASQTSRLSSLADAKVYFLGKDTTFQTSTLFGQAASITNANINISGNQALVEGNNYFAFTYSLADDALNDEVIAAELTDVNISGTTETLADPVTAQRTVKNIFRAIGGAYTRTLYDDWIYTDTKSTMPAYTDRYDFVIEDRIVTFIPAVAGAVAEIDFSSFDVYYSNTAYGVKAVFEIYSGQTVNADNLLWKLDDAAKSKTGPGNILRSTAADGSITIKFNANTTVSSYAGTGWTATVTPFVNHNMEVEEVDAFQTNTNNLQPGSTNQEIIGFWVKTEGNLSTQKVKEIKIDLKNSESAVEKVSVFYTANQNNFSTATLFGSTTDFSKQEITITGEQELPEGTSYFWVAYDIKGLAAADAQVDAALISVKTEDETPYLPANGDPDGYRLIKNTVELTNGDNGQMTLAQCTKFYDEGGPDLDYRDVSTFPFDGKITFLPYAAGEAVKLEFVGTIDITCTNYLYVYEGAEVDPAKLVTTISCSTSPASVSYPQPIISGSPDGALTVRFVAASKPSISYKGWEADVCSYTKVPLYVDNITTTQVGAADIMRGSENVAVQQIKIVVKGDYNEVALNDFNFTNGVTTNAADIANAALYYTATSTGILLDNQVGESAVNSPYIFTAAEDIKIDKAGTYYFYLAYDIKQDANPGNTIGANLTGISVNGIVNSDITVGSAVNRNIKSGLKGTYIIGRSATADYATFAAAVSAAQAGIEGAVIFKIEPDTYNENVLVSAIPGTSASSTLTFTSLSGNNDDVVIAGSGLSTSNNGIFKVLQTSYVVLENVTLKPSSQSYAYDVYITDQSRYFTLRNCILQANVITGTGIYSGMNLVYVQGINEEGKNCDYFTAEDNTFIGGYIGVYMYGTSYVALTKQRGAVIRNNMLVNQYSKGIYLPDEQDALIENNTITNSTSSYSGSQGMDIARPTGQLIVRNNKINLSPNSYTYGIYLRYGITGTEQNPMLIYNNSISIASTSASSYGICISTSSSESYSYIDFYHNSVNISGTGGRCFGITGSIVAFNNMVFQNNLLQNNTASGSVYFFGNVAQYQAFTFSNNAYYCNGDFTNTQTTFADWTTASNEQNSFVEQAEFTSPSDLHLIEPGGLNAALPVDFITEDADGNPRSLTTPTIGAYEYESVVEVKPEIEDGYPQTGTITYNSIEFKTKWNQSGNLYGIIKKASEEAPTKSELLATTAISLNNGVEYTSKFISLDEETEYKAYFILVSDLDVESDIVVSDIAQTTAFPSDETAPTAPANLEGIATETTIELSWTASTDNVAVAGYNVYVDGVLVETVTGTSYTITGLSPSTSYTIEVEAFDAAGNKSEKVSAVISTIDEADETAPTAPANLEGVVSETTIELSWTASTDNVAVAGYNVYVDGVLVETVTGTSYTIIGLSPGTTYTIEVEAFDAAGNTSDRAFISLSTTLSTSTGLDNINGENTFSVYPNPFTDYIIVNTTADGIATIYNLSGNAILNVNLKNGSNRIDASALPKGAYMLKFNENTIKIMK